jgi:xylulokinase
MAGRQLYLGVDSGTQGTKAVLLDRSSGEILARAHSNHDLIQDNRGTREQHPAWWIDACERVITEITGKTGIDPGDIRAIGVSGQQHGFVPLDRDGRVIRAAKLWCDTATAAEADVITERAGGAGRVIRCVGNSVAAGFTASKILWLAENEPENYKRLATVLLPHDYINFWLTGARKTEYGDASGTAYFDVTKRRWSAELLQAIDPQKDLARCLPELVEPDVPVGVVRPELAAKFGFSGGVLVASGGGDNMMAAIGTGNVSPGVVTASLGTSGTIYAYSDTPVVDPQGELAAFCSSTGGWLPLVCTMNVTVATELTRAVLQLDTAGLNSLAGNAAPGCDGLVLLPFFNGERTPALPGASATLHGLTPGNYNRANLCRSAIEGATFGLRYGMDVLNRQGIAAREIRLTGGGARSPLWRQVVADIFNCPVVRPVEEESGAFGAALQALWCHLREEGQEVSIRELADAYVKLDEDGGAWPLPQTARLYRELYQRYLALETLLRPTYRGVS